jgi:hypothetical protein
VTLTKLIESAYPLVECDRLSKSKKVVDEDEIDDLRSQTLDYSNVAERKKELDSVRSKMAQDGFDVQHSTRIILPDRIRIAVSMGDYEKLQLARRFEDLAAWNFLSQIMLSSFFALAGIALERGNEAFVGTSLASLIVVGFAAGATTLAYWIPIFKASRSNRKRPKRISVTVSSQNSLQQTDDLSQERS